MKKINLLLCGLLVGCARKTLTTYSGHGSESVSQKLLEKFAPKPIEPAKLNRIEALLDLKSPGRGLLSSDGQNLYFSWSVTGTKQIWKLNKKFGFPIQMTGGQDRTNLSTITPDGKYLVLSRDEKGNEYPFVYLQKTSGGPLELVAGKKKVISRAQFVTLDSRYLYYTMNDSDPVIHSLYKMDLKTRKKTKVHPGIKGYMQVADYRENGDILLVNHKGNIMREYFLFNEKTKNTIPVVGHDEMEEYSVRFAPKRGEYLVLTNKFGEYRRLYLMEKGQFKAITPKVKYDVRGFSVSRDRTRILYSINRDGYGEVVAMRANNFKKIDIPFKRTKGVLQIYFGRTTSNSRYTVFSVTQAKAPGTSYVFDWKTGRKKQWTYPSSPEINTKNFVETKLDYYTNRDGIKIPMFVMRPKQCDKKAGCPVIVNLHGGPESQWRPWFRPEDQLYMEEGFILVRPNVRGSDGYGKSWLNADNGPKRLDIITDIEDVSRFIKKNWAVRGVEPKVGVMGASYGGYSTNVAMTLFAGAYDAGVSVVGMSHLVTFLENTGPYRRHLRITEYGDPVKDREALNKLSPMTYLDKIQDPVLVIHGATDPRVPVGEAIQIYNKMKSKGLEGELIVFPDEGHGIRKRKNRAVYIANILGFFKKHLR